MALLLFLVINVVLVVLLIGYNKTLSNQSLLIFLILFVVIISTIASWIEPKADYDLTRYYRILNTIKHTNINIVEYTFKGTSGSDGNYRYTYTFNALMYIIGKYGFRELLPFISCMVTYGIISYITYSISKSRRVRGWQLATLILLVNGMMPAVFVISNIRTAMAFSIAGLAVFTEATSRKKSFFRFITLLLIAGTIHPISIIVGFVYYIFRYWKPRPIYTIIALSLPIVFYIISKNFISSSNDFLRYIGFKYYNYMFVNEYSQGDFFRLASILYSVMALIEIYTIILKSNDRHNNVIVNTLGWYSMIIISMIQSYQISMRLLFFIAVLSPVLINKLIYIRSRKIKIILFIINGFVLAFSYICLLENYLWLA